MTEPITLILGSVGPAYDRGLTALLRDECDLQIVAESLELGELESELARCSPDVCIIGHRYVSSPLVLKRLGSIRPGIGFVVLASEGLSERWRTQLFAFGVHACLPEHASRDDLLTAVRYAANGKFVSIPASNSTNDELSAVLLTDRETEVFQLVQHGMSNRQIAQELRIAPETVSTHVKRIRLKLGVRRRSELVPVHRCA